MHWETPDERPGPNCEQCRRDERELMEYIRAMYEAEVRELQEQRR